MTAIIARSPAGAKSAPLAAQKPAPTQHGQPPAAEPLSLSMIVLSLRPNGPKFNGNRIERAQEAGFGWLKSANLIGLSHPDTGDEVARHVINNRDELFEGLKEIQVHIDPEQCAWMWKAGSYLAARLKKYAILVGARICDGLGQPLDDAAIDAIAKHIDDVMTKRRDADREARTVTLPSGERRVLSELSFAYMVEREAGSKKHVYRDVLFDAPAMHYYEGKARGVQMAGEIVQFYRRHKEDRLRLGRMLREAMQNDGTGYGNWDKAEVANVTSGFMEVIEVLIELGARNLNPAWLKQKIEQNQQAHLDWCEDRAKRKAEFVERMRQGREAKKNARTGGAT